jgi:predicted anti-sigma-YlaC factor YlaD
MEQETRDACPAWEPELEALLAGELGGEREAAAREHLASCPGCRRAMESAGRGREALEAFSEAPLPWPAPTGAEVTGEQIRAWRALQARLGRASGRGRRWWSPAWWPQAAAALLLLGAGIGIGRWTGHGASGPGPVGAGREETAPAQAAVAALVRADLLTDAGLSFAHGLQEMVTGVMGLEVSGGGPAEREAVRERARELVHQAALLRRDLDPVRDADLLLRIRQAELLLEEIAALAAGSGPDLVLVRELVARQRLGEGDLERRLTTAIAEARRQGGWNGKDGESIREELR